MQNLPNSDREIVNLHLFGVDLIANERSRQVINEGYVACDDDNHTEGELARAAVHYATPVPLQVVIDNSGRREGVWPFANCFNKKSQHCRLKQLAIAGALIAAEIDRLQRLIERYPTKSPETV